MLVPFVGSTHAVYLYMRGCNPPSALNNFTKILGYSHCMYVIINPWDAIFPFGCQNIVLIVEIILLQ